MPKMLKDVLIMHIRTYLLEMLQLFIDIVC
jgi:hypothetical protein